MSKGGGQGSFAQMQEPSMDVGGFGGGGPQPAPAFERPQMDNRMGMPSYDFQPIMRNQGPDSFSGGVPQTQPFMEEPVPLGIADNLNADFIPYSPDNASGGSGKTVIGGEGLLYQLQPIDQPIASPQPQPPLGIGDSSNPMLQELRPLPQPGGFDGAMRRFNNLSAGDRERLGDLGIDYIFGSGPRMVGETPRFEFNTVTQGPESMPRLEEQMRMNEVSGPARPDPLGGVDLNRFSGGLGSKGGRSNPYQTDGIVPPPALSQTDIAPIEQPVPFKSGPVEPRVKPQPMPPKFQPMPIDRFFPQPMPPRQAPIFGPPRNFPFPMPRPPRMPPRQPPRMPGRNTQFQMPFFGSPYGQMNPYAGQFSGYGVPSNMFSFAQPHYQPYVPQAYTPPPPVMQLPPDQGNQAFSGGFGNQGIGGFGRYNLGLARRQFGGR